MIIIMLLLTQLAFARKTIIKMATLAPEGTDWHGMLVEMGQEWKKATKGRVHLRLYPGGVVGEAGARVEGSVPEEEVLVAGRGDHGC